MRVKLKLFGSDKKSGFVQIDFLFAVGIFFMIVYFIYIFSVNFENSYSIASEVSQMQADARDICLLLISSSGFPNDWEGSSSSLNIVGLKEKDSPFLDIDKVNALNNSVYFDVLDSLDTGSYLYLEIDNLNLSNNYLRFGTKSNTSSNSFSYSCYSNLNGELVKVKVEVWK